MTVNVDNLVYFYFWLVQILVNLKTSSEIQYHHNHTLAEILQFSEFSLDRRIYNFPFKTQNDLWEFTEILGESGLNFEI